MIPQISASFLVVVRARDKGESVRAEREAVGLRIALPENCPWWLSLNVTLDFKYKYEEYLIVKFSIYDTNRFRIYTWMTWPHRISAARARPTSRLTTIQAGYRRATALLPAAATTRMTSSLFRTPFDSLSRSHLMSTQIRVCLHSTRSVKSEGLNINKTFTNFAIACLIVLYNLLRRFILSSMSWFTVASVYKFRV